MSQTPNNEIIETKILKAASTYSNRLYARKDFLWHNYYKGILIFYSIFSCYSIFIKLLEYLE